MSVISTLIHLKVQCNLCINDISTFPNFGYKSLKQSKTNTPGLYVVLCILAHLDDRLSFLVKLKEKVAGVPVIDAQPPHQLELKYSD